MDRMQILEQQVAELEKLLALKDRRIAELESQPRFISYPYWQWIPSPWTTPTYPTWTITSVDASSSSPTITLGC